MISQEMFCDRIVRFLYLLHRAGVGNFFQSAGRFKNLFGPSSRTFHKTRTKIYVLHQLHLARVKKATLRARHKVLAGRIWPAGHTLPTPDIERLRRCHSTQFEAKEKATFLSSLKRSMKSIQCKFFVRSLAKFYLFRKKMFL